MKKINNYIILILLLTVFNALYSQDLSNCNTNTITLLDDGNNFSSSAIATIDFENNCGCNTTSNCEIVSLVIPSNYTCQGMVASLIPTIDWYEDHFDIYYLPSCDYDGNDDFNTQKSNYLFTIDPVQTGGIVEVLICAGDELPVGQNSVEINFTTSDLCFIEDCTSDVSPPTCSISDITIDGESSTGVGTITFTDFVTDNCGGVSFSDGNDLTNGIGVSNIMDYPCGSTTQFEVAYFDDAGNGIVCNLTVTVTCDDIDPPSTNGEFIKVYSADVAMSNSHAVGIKFHNNFIYGVGRVLPESLDRTGFLYKLDLSGNELYTIKLPNDINVNNLFVDDDRIIITGHSGDFSSGNNSVILRYMDDGTNFSIESLQEVDLDASREAIRGTVRGIDGSYFHNGHDGAFSADDVRLTKFDNQGNYVSQMNYDFSDDQMWSPLVADLNNSVSLLGEEANDTNEGFIINIDENLNVIDAVSLFGAGWVWDMITVPSLNRRIAISNRKVIYLDSQLEVLSALHIDNVTRNNDIVGPITESNGDLVAYVISGIEISGTPVNMVTKINIESNDVSIIWSKYLDIGNQILNDSKIEVTSEDHLLISGTIDNSASGNSNEVFIAHVSPDNCYLVDVDITTSVANINVVHQTIIESNKTDPVISLLTDQSTFNLSCNNIQPCVNLDQCTDECSTQTVDLSTGVDFNNGSLLPVGQYEGGWQMISGPDMTLTYPKPGYVLDPNSPWDDLPGAVYISPFANSSNNGMFDIPYTFERKFCVCESLTEVQLDVSALVDNFITIGLYDEAGNEIENLITYDGNAHPSTFQLPAFTYSGTHTLTAGEYSLRAGLRNDGTATMGMAINATITGAGLIESKCCSPFTILSGTVFADEACNSQNDFGVDLGIEGVEVQLCDISGNPIATTITDMLGYYTFNEIEIGDYIVKQAPINGQDLSLGADGYEINIQSNTVTGDIDFGNCTECAIDLVEPICNSQDILVELNQNGVASIIPSMVDNDSFDECSEVTLTLDISDFNCDHLGENSVLLIVTDASGNTSVCDATVTIEDKLEACFDCCATSEMLSNQVVENVNLSLIDMTEEGFILENPDLLECQHISKIFWGDGLVDDLDPNDELPEHIYGANGLYLISIEVTSVNSNGDVCQTDIVDLEVLIKNCDMVGIEFENLEYTILKVYPIPTQDILNIQLNKNNGGYSAKILNNIGQIVANFAIENGATYYSFNTESLSSGVYNIILESNLGNQSLSTRMIKI